MSARLLFHEKTVFEDGTIFELRIWSVSEPVTPATHGYKYSLFFGRPGERLVGLDNERGKGNHMHVLGHEKAYAFISIAQLLQDFRHEVETVKDAGI